MDTYQNGIVSSANMYFAASVDGPQREDTQDVNVKIRYVLGNGKIQPNWVDLGTWDKQSGGSLDSEETTYHPGGMADRISLGGRQIPENVTVSRIFRHQDQDRLANLFNGVGKSPAVISVQGMDLDGNAYGTPVVWSGILKKVTPPPRDSEGTAAAMIELEFTVNAPTT